MSVRLASENPVRHHSEMGVRLGPERAPEPAEGGKTEPVDFDSDRHPGNILFDLKPGKDEVGYQPIDWGQLLKLTEEGRARIVRLMSYAQVFEQVGPVDQLFRKMTEELGIPKENRARLQRSLRALFPNTSGNPRSGLAPYYFLLAELETAGLERDILNYEFIRAIYQLEAYETLLSQEGSQDHPSPKRRLGERVTEDIGKLTTGLTVSQKEKIKTALFHPKAALTAARNARLARDGLLEQDRWLATLGASKDARDRLISTLPKNPKTAGELHQALLGAIKDPKLSLSSADRQSLENWKTAIQAQKLDWDALSPEDYRRISSGSNILQEIRKNSGARQRPPLPQPEKQSIASSVGNVYAAELLNAVFWSLVDQNPALAQQWVDEALSLDKHAGFAAFAAASGTYSALTNRMIPMSQRALRYFNQGGVSLAVGITAGDIAHRLLSGQSTAEVIQHLKSDENLKELGFSTLSFMAANAVVDHAVEKIHPCSFRFKKLLKTTASFVGASAIDRTLREPLTSMGVLDREKLQGLRDLARKFSPLINARIEGIQKLYDEGRDLEALQEWLGLSDQQMAEHLRDAPPEFWEKSREGSELRRKFYSNIFTSEHHGSDPLKEGTFEELIHRYRRDLHELTAHSTDSFLIAMAQKEVSATYRLMESLEVRFYIKDTEKFPRSYSEIPTRYRKIQLPPKKSAPPSAPPEIGSRLEELGGGR